MAKMINPTVTIPINKPAGQTNYVIIDADMYAEVIKYNWAWVSSTRVFRDNLKRTYLHRLIMNAGPGQKVEFQSQNRFDLRRSNLKLVEDPNVFGRINPSTEPMPINTTTKTEIDVLRHNYGVLQRSLYRQHKQYLELQTEYNRVSRLLEQEYNRVTSLMEEINILTAEKSKPKKYSADWMRKQTPTKSS